MRVAVYWNLHKDCYSIVAREGAKYGRVIGYKSEVVLRECNFTVSESRRLKVIAEKTKNVHAYVVGEWEIDPPAMPSQIERVRYNPYLHPRFYGESGDWTVAHRVWCVTENEKPSVYALPSRKEP